MPSHIVAEGDVDRAFLRGICPGLANQIPEPEERAHPGREAAIRTAGLSVKLVNQRTVLVLDKNGHSIDQLESEIVSVLTPIWGSPPVRRGNWWALNNSGLRLVIAGLPGNPLLTELGITRFMSDDYLLKLLLTNESLLAFCGGETRLSYKPTSSDVLREILTSVVSTLRQRGIAIDTSKRYTHLARSIMGFDARPATFAEHLILRSPPDVREQVAGHLRREIEDDPPF